MMEAMGQWWSALHGTVVERKGRYDNFVVDVAKRTRYDKETNTGGSNGATMRFAPGEGLESTL